MDPIRLGARVEHRSLDELEAGFADRVTPRALFLSRQQLIGEPDVVVGARVHVEVLLASGTPGLVVDGVVAWSISDKPPPGREPGLGVAITFVDDDTAQRLRRMAARPGAGGRVRVPGQRLADRLRLGAPMIAPPMIAGPTVPASPAVPVVDVVTPPAPPRPTFASLFPPSAEPAPLVADLSAEPSLFTPRPTTSTIEQPAAPSAERPAPTASAERFGATSLGDPSSLSSSRSTSMERPDGEEFVGVATTEMPALPRPRLMGLLADRSLGDSEPDAAAHDSDVGTAPSRAAANDLVDADVSGPGNFLEAPTLDGVDNEPGDTSLPSQEMPPFSLSSSASSEGLDSLPDAPPLGRSPFGDDDEPQRPFESQSTDVDLLASISAADIVALDLAAQQARAEQSAANLVEPEAGLDDLPDADADLLSHGDWELRTDHAADDGAADDVDSWPSLELSETLVLDLRSLPEPGSWPVGSDLVDARPVGVFCSFGRRGLQNVEPFTWPTDGTKRFSRGELPPEPVVDNDVFAGAGDVDLFAGSPDHDPFASAGTDPRLNVEGVVARAVRAAHGDGDGDGDVDVFSSSADGEATRDEMLLPALAVAKPPSSEAEGDTDFDLRRPPPGKTG